MTPIDERVLWLVAGVVLGWLLHWLWSRAPRARAVKTPPPEPGSIVPAPVAAPEPEDATATSPAPASSRLIDVGAARAAGFNLKHADDLTIIERIGPKTDDLLRANGIRSFAQLARLQVADLVEILERGGPSFRLANPVTWPQQALLAAENRWAELKRMQQDQVDGMAPADTS